MNNFIEIHCNSIRRKKYENDLRIFKFFLTYKNRNEKDENDYLMCILKLTY